MHDALTSLNKKKMQYRKTYSQCLKITQNVAFEFLNFGIFHHFFVLLEVKNVNVARFARNVECDFFGRFSNTVDLEYSTPKMGVSL